MGVTRGLWSGVGGFLVEQLGVVVGGGFPVPQDAIPLSSWSATGGGSLGLLSAEDIRDRCQFDSESSARSMLTQFLLHVNDPSLQFG